MSTSPAHMHHVPLYRTETDHLVVTAHAKTNDSYWGRLTIDTARGTWKLVTTNDEVVSHGIWTGKLSGAAFVRFLKSMGTLAGMVAPIGYEHRADCDCECGSISEGTDLTVAWEHDRHCECDCGAITE